MINLSYVALRCGPLIPVTIGSTRGAVTEGSYKPKHRLAVIRISR
jgi:hypothetical protein